MKKIFRPIVVVAIIAAILFVVLCILGKYKEERDKKLWAEAEKKQIEEMLAPFREDKGGAATPQEALRGYQQALLRGDIEGAMSFVFLDRKNDIRSKLEAKSVKEMREYAEGLPKSEELELNERESFDCDKPTCAVKYQANYHYSYWVNEVKKVLMEDGDVFEMPAGEYGSSIDFVQKLDDKWQLDEMP